jgi:hypothetical protein
MMLKLVAFVSAILYSSAVLAQTSSTTSSAAAATHTVSVGAVSEFPAKKTIEVER